MADDLVEWLRAQLDADERLAREAGGGAWHQTDPERETGRIEDESGEVVVYDEGSPNGWQAEHIATWDPSRVLREVEAKRKIIDEYEHEIKRGPARPHVPESVARHEAICDAYSAALRILAAVYADLGRPGYQESWRPT